MNQEKNSYVKKVLDKNKGSFIARAIVWFVLLLVPAIYLFFKYDCYKFTSKLSFSGWGILALIIGIGSIFVLLRYIVYGKTYRYWKQVVKGILQVLLPMLLIIGIVQISINFLKELMTFLITATACWFTAYLINPFPEWAYKKTLGETADTLDYAFSRFKEKENSN